MFLVPAIYNEVEPYVCDWLENLIAAGHIAPGTVERRSIRDLTPEDVQGPGQRHYFSGVGTWSLALRRAGWPDDFDVWSGSCPCTPFSQAGRQKGEEDERHLWPEWFRLIAACRPAVVLGEQVASVAVVGKPVGRAGSGDGEAPSRPWLDIVRADLEAIGYIVGATVLPACCVGAPHIRSRLFFVGIRPDVVGDPRFARSWRHARAVSRSQGEGSSERIGTGSLADILVAAGATRVPAGPVADTERSGHGPGRIGTPHGRASVEPDRHGPAHALADDDDGSQGVGAVRVRVDGDAQHGLDPNGRSPVGGFWSDARWVPCRDGKARPAKPGIEPLAHGAPTRVVADGSVETQPRGAALKAYGNGIVTEVLVAFIEGVIDVLGLRGADTTASSDHDTTAS